MKRDARATVKRAGVIGLGAMGLQMARHMASKGFAVAGYDIDVDAMARAVEHGVQSLPLAGASGRACRGRRRHGGDRRARWRR